MIKLGILVFNIGLVFGMCFAMQAAAAAGHETRAKFDDGDREACRRPAWRRIFSEISASATGTDAVLVRENHVGEMCSLADFERLTDLEGLDDADGFTPQYRAAIADFAIQNVSGFLAGVKYIHVEAVFRRLLRKMTSEQQAIEIREAFLSIVESCNEFVNLSGPYDWERTSCGARSALNVFFRKNENTFCHRRSGSVHLQRHCQRR